MSREKQIEELTTELVKTNSYGTLNAVAEHLYNAGYRKQSDNTIEIVRCKECWNCEKVPSILGIVLYCNEWCKDVDENTFCSFGVKMKGGAE